ncbi:MAG: hypothetical protein KME18_18225 [Phormidium tanganyikae FI6-MK23]|jgi:hypothetical protein|nr:hypothetical protein [Phormidium tanganyikae FI6-MK23]
MKYILEVYYRGDCIEHREYASPIIAPRKGERIRVEFQNKNYYEESIWWIVEDVHHIFFSMELQTQTVQLFCVPDPQDGQ